MKKPVLSICFLLMVLGFGKPVQAQFYVGKTVSEFINICTSEDTALRDRCYGYVSGILDFQRLSMQRLGLQGALFCPSAIVVAERVVPDYLRWIKGHPGAQIGVPLMSLYMYFQEKNPCPAVSPAEAQELGLPVTSPHIIKVSPDKNHDHPHPHSHDHDHPHSHP